jgi:hypothetical protein
MTFISAVRASIAKHSRPYYNSWEYFPHFCRGGTWHRRMSRFSWGLSNYKEVRTMRHSSKSQSAILGSLITVFIVTLTACGGGGTSSGAGAGASGVASVSGTVNGGSATALNMNPGVGPAFLMAALGDMVISAAHAAGIAGVNVEVNCGPGAMYNGTTDINGKFKIMVPNVGTGNCTTTFNGFSGPPITLTLGMETEIEVTLAASSVNLVGIQQHASSQTELEIEVDDGADNVASRSDDAMSSDDDSMSHSPSNETVSHDSDSDDDDSQSIDHANNSGDDPSSGGTGRS